MMNYIPLEKKRKSNLDINSPSKKRRRMKPLSFGGDSRILHRIKGLMVPPFIDEDQLLSDLQDTYPEYRRKKRGSLRAAVKKAMELFAVDGDDSNEGDSGQSFVNDVESSPDERYVEYEDARFPKKTKLKENKEYLQAKGTVSTQNGQIRNDVSDSNVQCPVTYAVDKSPKILKNSTQGLNTQNSNVQKSKEIPTRLKKQGSKGPILQYPEVTFADIGGQESILEELYELLLPLRYPKLLSPEARYSSCCVLLHGPPGCGKTLLVRAIAGEMKFPLIEVVAANLISGISGQTEDEICNIFEQAANSSPCILFFDEIDAIGSKREFTSRGMEKRVVSQLLKSMDDLGTKYVDSRVLVIGATNTPDALDPAFRRGERFDQEIFIGIPDETTRISILQVVCKNWKLSPDLNVWLAKRTPGYTGADLAALVKGAVKKACQRMVKKLCVILESNSVVQKRLLHLMAKEGLQVNSVTEVPKELLNATKANLVKLNAFVSMSDSEADPLIEKLMKDFRISAEDFQATLDTYVPYCKREGFATVPSVPWNRVGGLKEVQEELKISVLWPLKYKKECDMYKYTPPSGILLWGPPGCGKTLLGKAVASECGVNFIPVKGPELLNMYVGQSERAIREVFQRARNAAPCVLFFDELDSICRRRTNSSENAAADRVVTQMLAEMDGLSPKTNIFIIGTTNRLKSIDSAMLRPGRLEVVLYVGLPSPEERVDILKALTKNGTEPKLADDVNLETLGLDIRCNGFSGADLESLLRIASKKALRDFITGNITDSNISKGTIASVHLDFAFANIRQSVSIKERKYFEMLKSSEEIRG